ncbi:ACH96174.1 GrBNV gp97-like protein [Kallithea virus]|uniref:ACH96174.1 GrBNV gp97-like protein n=1 Tax=Kallithea virus TaxID=1654582 RepID=A0A1S5VG23_9VIRU|nr:ACH96174.1 GrBNV gp97-like protein [Kallithea virus]AQN78588.1 ACH96174.1 GrBNV gp97-like protein [Kallithea virus]
MSEAYYFDESIFTTGESFLPFNHVNVYNKADRFLVERANLQMGYEVQCEQSRQQRYLQYQLPEQEPKSLPDVVVNLNPKKPCRGINIYSFNIANNRIEKTISFNQIKVSNASIVESDMKPVMIEEYTPNSIYTVGDLTPFESAIMIKYYTINNANVTITQHLYLTIEKFFDNVRNWFDYKSNGSIQNQYGEIWFENKIINVPLMFADPTVVDIY